MGSCIVLVALLLPPHLLLPTALDPSSWWLVWARWLRASAWVQDPALAVDDHAIVDVLVMRLLLLVGDVTGRGLARLGELALVGRGRRGRRSMLGEEIWLLRCRLLSREGSWRQALADSLLDRVVALLDPWTWRELSCSRGSVLARRRGRVRGVGVLGVLLVYRRPLTLLLEVLLRRRIRLHIPLRRRRRSPWLELEVVVRVLDGEVLMGYSAAPAAEHAPLTAPRRALVEIWPREERGGPDNETRRGRERWLGVAREGEVVVLLLSCTAHCGGVYDGSSVAVGSC